MKSLAAKVSSSFVILCALSLLARPCFGGNEEAKQQDPVQYETALLDLLKEDEGLAKQRAEAYQQIVSDIDKTGNATQDTVKRILVLAQRRGQHCLRILNCQLDGGRYPNAIDVGTRVAEDLEKDIVTGIENKAREDQISEIRYEVKQIYALVGKAYKALGQEDEGNRALQKANEHTG